MRAEWRAISIYLSISISIYLSNIYRANPGQRCICIYIIYIPEPPVWISLQAAALLPGEPEYVSIHVYIYMYTYMYVYIYMFFHAYVCVRMYTNP